MTRPHGIAVRAALESPGRSAGAGPGWRGVRRSRHAGRAQACASVRAPFVTPTYWSAAKLATATAWNTVKA
jgi:hypothetical protein